MANELIRIDGGNVILDADTASLIAGIERQMAYLKEQSDALKAALLAEMEAKGVIKITTDDLTIRYIAETDREWFNKDRFREDSPQIYDLYVEMKPVKASVRVSVKKK